KACLSFDQPRQVCPHPHVIFHDGHSNSHCTHFGAYLHSTNQPIAKSGYYSPFNLSFTSSSTRVPSFSVLLTRQLPPTDSSRVRRFPSPCPGNIRSSPFPSSSFPSKPRPLS